MQSDKDNHPQINNSYVPITLHQVEQEMDARITHIHEELKKGFDLIKHQPKSVSIFGSSRFTEENMYYQKARTLGHELARRGYSVITGGGPGIMEAANRGAAEAHGRSIGLNIVLPYEQTINPYANQTMEFNYFFTRKVMLTFSAEAYIFFPGGFGTMDEFFEILTLVQTRKIEKVPLILFGSDYWKELITFMEKQMVSRNAIDTDDFNLFLLTDSIDDIVSVVEHVPIRNGVRLKKAPPVVGDAL